MQVVLVAFVVGSALTAAAVGSRLGAALGLGLVGFGVTGLFIVQGAPDLVLTQLLVETVVVVGFVIGLGHLARRFPAVGRSWHTVRLSIAGLAGAAVTVGLLATQADRAGTPPVEALVAGAVDPGGGNNTVNVILTDIRALDTLGEILVLLVVGVGVLALARPARSTEPTAAEPVAVEEPA